MIKKTNEKRNSKKNDMKIEERNLILYILIPYIFYSVLNLVFLNAQNTKFNSGKSEWLSEFISGNKNTYRSKEHPKARGIDLSIDYPKSWLAKEGKRPHVVQGIYGGNLEGKISCVLVMIPLPEGVVLSKEDIEQMLDKKNLPSLLPESFTYIDGGNTLIEQIPSAYLLYRVELERMGLKLNGYGLMHMFYYNNIQVQIQFSVLVPEGTPEEVLVEKFDQNKLLFNMMTNSVIVYNQYQ